MGGHGKADIYVAYTGHHYMLLAPSPRNADFGNDGFSSTGKHFPFAYSRKTQYGNFVLYKMRVVLSAVPEKHKGAQPFLYSGPEHYNPGVSVFRGQPMGVSSSFRISGNF